MPDHEVIPAFDASALPHVGTYRRVLPVSLVRMYENALDWEHLPCVHDSSFQSIDCLDAGPWGWRARTTAAGGGESEIELRLDRVCRRWITRTLKGPNQGAEIWTHAFEIEPFRVDIVVDFFVPGVAPENREKVGRLYAGLYTKLYDEDVAMMVERQRQLDRRVTQSQARTREVALGARKALSLPQKVEVGSREYVLNELEGALVVYPALCPHQLGPLLDAELIDGVVTCPWHGYRFDVVSGDCLSGHTCRLIEVPLIEERDGQVLLRARH